MNEITRVGVDLAKRQIQVHAMDAMGRGVAAKALDSLMTQTDSPQSGRW